MRKIFMKVAMLAIAAPALLSGCATIFGHSSYPVSINSNPTGATVSITDKKGKEVYKGASPATVILKSSAGFFGKAEYQVKISSAGYGEQIIPVNYKLNGWYFGNLLIGGVLGMLIVDPATGAMWKLDTPPINVTLSKSTAAITPSLKIVDLASIPENVKDKLVRIK
ncbi:MAG: hypothetical protein JWQ09_238 [Segetibacter sp.]|nr:hypothetical protein [Segetibacter sp.]